MSFLQLLVLSLVQGVTEWLPVSSSGHVLLVATLFGLGGDDELLINAMAHVGTLGSAMIYFRKDVWRAILGAVRLAGLGDLDDAAKGNRRLAMHIIAATPVAFVLAAGSTLLPEELGASLRSLWVVIGTTVIFALLLWWADRNPETRRQEADMTLADSVLIGATQGIAAILPGTSRSGITMTTARARGFSRTEAARFSMLIGMPIIAASGVFAFVELANAAPGSITLTLQDGIVAAAFSFVSGYASIAVLMRLLSRTSFLPFVIYRLILGVLLLLASPVALNLIPA